MSAPDVSRQVVEFLGRPAMWRGVVFGGAGVFLVVAAASSGPDQAQGLDGSLCKIATTPLGPDSALLVRQQQGHACRVRAAGWPGGSAGRWG
ncbi:MAG: DUF1206 domain-containing protein [Streptosporangiaceae bacterium]